MPIDPCLVWPKAIYFLLFSGWCSAGSFFSLVFKSVLGWDEITIGIVSACQPIMAFALVPIWTGFADRSGLHRPILFTTAFLMGTVPLVLFLKPPTIISIGIWIFYSVISVPIGPIVDAMVLAMLGPDRADEYGRQRLYGTLGCGVISVCMGFLVQATSFLAPFFVRVISIFTLLAVLYKAPLKFRADEPDHKVGSGEYASLDQQASGRESSEKGHLPHNASDSPDEVHHVGWTWLLNVRVLSLYLSMLSIGLSLSTIGTFEWLYLIGLGAPTSLLGFASLFSITFEIPMFFFSKTVISKLGTTNSILIAMAALSLRCALYTFLHECNVHFVVFIELLHGICFGTAWSAAVKVAAQIAPKGCESLSQGILNCIFSGLGPAIGMLGGGMVYRSIGPHAMWWCLSALNLAVAVVFWAVCSWEESWKQRWTGFAQLGAEAEADHEQGSKRERGTKAVEMVGKQVSLKSVAVGSEFFKDEQSVASIALPPLAPAPAPPSEAEPRVSRAASRMPSRASAIGASGLMTRPRMVPLRSSNLAVLLSSQSSLHHPHNLNTMTPGVESRGDLFGATATATASSESGPRLGNVTNARDVGMSTSVLVRQMSARSPAGSAQSSAATVSVAELSRRSSWMQNEASRPSEAAPARSP
ncbi:MFS general substrate transporter [Gonapodya prolifera JEL478]|uniref:MFS general substrate transporter n=1 Tax=Gonapodya prolifera (strain JEL478) TaxID=1344416 RepID=A0A139AGS8_GONPJ|nr:MFS general substrate transporter [Gonapodya prolifera JEL478]|eukprot:KXS16032.1 MFS general substrate transporter [Gonapodya prolifera JEL478]